jgi:hypothetical protein
MTAAIVTLCELAVTAINAAAAAGDFPKPVTAAEDYALTLATEASQDWIVFVQPGPALTKPATLNGGLTEQFSIRLIIHTQCRADDVAAIKSLLGVVELAGDAVRGALTPEYSFTGAGYMSSGGEANHIYDPVRLRDDAVFLSEQLLNIDTVRDPG